MEDQQTNQQNDQDQPEENESQPKTTEGTKQGESATIKNAWKQVENIGQALGEALQGRGNVVMVRINDEALKHLDMLVEAEVVKSRSEAAALLINEGIQTNEDLFKTISEVTQKISVLRDQLREKVKIQREEE